MWLWVVSILIVFAPLLEGGTTHLAVMIIRFLILALAVIYAWQGLKRGAFPRPALVIGLPVLAYLALAVISTLTSVYTDQSRQWLLVLSSYAGLLALLVCFVKQWDHIAVLMLVFLVTAVGEAGYALLEASQGAIRPNGTFFNPNFLAVYLAGAWAMTFAYLCYAVPRRHLTWLPPRGTGRFQGTPARPCLLTWWAPCAAILILLTLAIVWTGSRGGLVALVAGAAVVASVRYGRRALAVLLLIVLVALLVPSPLQERFVIEHSINPETYARWQMWGRSLLEMTDHPLGIGLGLYQYWAPQYMFPIEGQILRYGKIARTAHNEYLQMGAELGVTSLPIFAWGVWLVGREGARVLAQRLRRRERGLVVGLLGIIACLLVHAAVDSTFHEPALALLLTMCVGLVLASRRLVQRNPKTMPVFPLSSRPAWVVVTCVTVLVVTAEIGRLGLAWQAYEAGTAAAGRYDFAQAITRYRTAVTLDPGKALYHSALASAYFQRFEVAHEPVAAHIALQEIQVAVSLNPLDGRLVALLGHVCESTALSGQAELSAPGSRAVLLTMAQAAYERAVELEPTAPFYRLELGRLAAELGDRTIAESWVRGAVELEPNFLPGREWLTRWYLASGRLEEANREVREIRDRQQRYATWSKDTIEARFLRADVSGLEAALVSVGAKAS